MIHLETNRLILRNWKNEDLHTFIKMNSDKEIMKFFPNILTKDETINFYNKINDKLNTYGYGLYACELKSNKNFIGFIGFHNTTLPGIINDNFIEIGWRINKIYWNNGFASEGALACIKHGFTNLNFQQIYSFTSKLNIPSQKVMKKIKMNYLKDFNHPRVSKNSKLYPHVLYYIKNDKGT